MEVYGEHALSETTYKDWFRNFESGDFDLSNKDCGKLPKKIWRCRIACIAERRFNSNPQKLAKVLGVDQGSISRHLHAIEKIQKEGKWVPYEFSKKTVKSEKPLVKFCLNISKESHFFALHCYWRCKVDPFRQSQAQKIMGRARTTINITTLCIWWDQKGAVYYELLKPGETVTGDRYRQQLIKSNQALKRKQPEWGRRTHKVILLHDNARPHVAKPVKTCLENIKWDVLPHAPYSPDLAPSDYYSHSTEYCRNMSEIFPIFHCKWNIVTTFLSNFEKYFIATLEF